MVLDRVRRAEFLEPDEQLVDVMSAHLGKPTHQPGGVVSILVAGAAGFALGFAVRPFGIVPAKVGIGVGFLGAMWATGVIAERRYGREVSLASLPWIALVHTSRRLVVLDYRALRRGEVKAIRAASPENIVGVTSMTRRAFGVIPMTTTVTIRFRDEEPELAASWSGSGRRLRRFIERLTEEDGLSSGA